ncbi:hypothetical protein CANTEDRAFT_112517 [Yamadazyma tenuis ATCC 10573]|uniref:RNase III domain-containing protein n=1 Tax=Candida tenuis (strain ATCC 10573 / BCRC 21748 / CBS 615 / JCM 9827 / NBRC 10315 / NRRL Y-1498 / VKM Y-70) TaxID=590646 RepID=G3AZQ3_CANTC|nr:uncharacterized protein CANTEDRAFT_112517 [Yamadazyma tenuis ATCC 10573]EGV65640.1 hypothetical protein CANTEDRAFT_112517 [Yamadazyma tenuis ATCC 10573]
MNNFRVMASRVTRVTHIPSQASRNIYLHKGPRLSGLKKDPLEVFTTSDGHKYDNDVHQNVKYIQDFLSDKFHIGNELALQVITHKSFANGIKPYNEKLSAMGSKILNLHLAKLVIEQPSKSSSVNELAINNKNLDVLGQPMSRELAGRLSLGVFAKLNKLNSVMFWNSYSTQGLNFEASGEMKVSAQMVYAMIGAVHFTHGKKVAEEFINEKIFPEVETITRDVVEADVKQAQEAT